MRAALLISLMSLTSCAVQIPPSVPTSIWFYPLTQADNATETVAASVSYAVTDASQVLLVPVEEQALLQVSVSLVQQQDCESFDMPQGYTSGGSVWLCPSDTALTDAQKRQVAFHLVGHVFGAQHVPCGQGVMSPTLNCYTPPDPFGLMYTAADFASICAGTTPLRPSYKICF